MKPALGDEISRRNNRRNRLHGSLRRFEKRETRSGSNPLRSNTQQVLPLGIRGVGLDQIDCLGFGASRDVTSRQTHRQAADCQNDQRAAAGRHPARTNPRMLPWSHFRSTTDQTPI
jgi:hypothetical protein